MKKHVLPALCVLVIGFISGYLSQGFKSSKIVADLGTPAHEQLEEKPRQARSTETSKLERSETEQMNSAVEQSTDYDLPKLLSLLESYYVYGEIGEHTPREILRENPLLALRLLEEFPKLEEGPIRDAARMQMIIAIMGAKPRIEPYLVKAMEAGQADIAHWNLLAETGPQTREGVLFFLNQIEQNNDLKKFQLSARALSKLSSNQASSLRQETCRSFAVASDTPKVFRALSSILEET